MRPQDMVHQFHRAFGLPIRHGAQIPDYDEQVLRYDLLHEEFFEYAEAHAEQDLVGIADALADIVYIAYGTAHAYGIDLDDVLAEVHRTNMAKLGPDGEPIRRSDGKVLKPQGWQPPRIARVLGLDAA